MLGLRKTTTHWLNRLKHLLQKLRVRDDGNRLLEHVVAELVSHKALNNVGNSHGSIALL